MNGSKLRYAGITDCQDYKTQIQLIKDIRSLNALPVFEHHFLHGRTCHKDRLPVYPLAQEISSGVLGIGHVYI